MGQVHTLQGNRGGHREGGSPFQPRPRPSRWTSDARGVTICLAMPGEFSRTTLQAVTPLPSPFRLKPMSCALHPTFWLLCCCLACCSWASCLVSSPTSRCTRCPASEALPSCRCVWAWTLGAALQRSSHTVPLVRCQQRWQPLQAPTYETACSCLHSPRPKPHRLNPIKPTASWRSRRGIAS